MNTPRNGFALLEWFIALAVFMTAVGLTWGSTAHGHASGGGHNHSTSEGLGDGGSAGGMASMPSGMSQMPGNLTGGGFQQPQSPPAAAVLPALTAPKKVQGTGAEAVSRNLTMPMNANLVNGQPLFNLRRGPAVLPR